MKKLIISALCIFGLVSMMQAQDSVSVLKNKRGMAILPVAGDIAIGIDADPFFDYLGNTMNGNAANSLNIGTTQIWGKYYLDNQTAVRVGLEIVNDRYNQREYVQNDAAIAADPLSQEQVIDRCLSKTKAMDLIVTYQKYRGYGRLQGYYGPFINLGMQSSKQTYTYGNPISAANPTPTSFWAINADNSRTTYNDNGRDYNIAIGVGGGVEYFFLPKISLGFDVFLAYRKTWETQSDSKTEIWDGTNVVERSAINSPGDRDAILATFTGWTNITVMFHF